MPDLSLNANSTVSPSNEGLGLFTNNPSTTPLPSDVLLQQEFGKPAAVINTPWVYKRSTPQDEPPTVQEIADDVFGSLNAKSAKAVPSKTLDTPDYITKRYKDNELGYSALRNNEDVYGQNQSRTSQLLHGVGKSAGIAGSSFISGTAGLIDGIFEAAGSGDFSKVYDNTITNGMDDFNKFMEEFLPNYYTKEQTEAGALDPANWATINFVADKLIKNMGYAFGAIGEGYVASKALMALGKLTKIGKSAEALAMMEKELSQVGSKEEKARKILANYETMLKEYGAGMKSYNKNINIMSASIASFAEANLEALEGKKKIFDDLQSQYISQNGKLPTGEDLDEIEKRAAEGGNIRLMLNIATLSVTNNIQFGKLFAGGFTGEKSILTREINDLGVKQVGKDVLDAEGKVISKGVEEATDRQVARLGDKYVSKELSSLERNVATAKKVGGYLVAPSEATEEGLQYIYETGTENYEKKKYNKEGVSAMKDIFVHGSEKLFSTKEGIESMILGALTGGIMESTTRDFINKEGATKAKNTEDAINQFNKAYAGTYIKELLESDVRGVGLQQEKEKAIKDNNVLDAKDIQYDFTHNYVLPRVKFGRFDQLKEELEQYRNKPLSDTITELGLPENTSKAEVDKKVNDLISQAETIKNVYESMNLRFSGLKNPKSTRENNIPTYMYNQSDIDKMTYQASKIIDYDKRMLQLKSELGSLGLDVNPLLDKTLREGKDLEEVRNELYKKASTLSPEVQQDLNGITVQSKLKDIEELQNRREQFLNEFEDTKEKNDQLDLKSFKVENSSLAKYLSAEKQSEKKGLVNSLDENTERRYIASLIQDRLAKGDDIDTIIEDIKSDPRFIFSESKKILLDEINKKIQSYQEQIDEFDEMENILMNDANGSATNEEIKRLNELLLAKTEDQRYQELDIIKPIISKLENQSMQIGALSTEPSLITKDQLKLKFALNTIALADNVISASQASDNYENIDDVERAITKVNALLEHHDKRNDEFKKSTYAQTLEFLAKEKLSELKEIKKKVEASLEDREKIQKQSELNYVVSQANLIEKNKELFKEVKDLDSLLEKAKGGDVVAIDIISDLFKKLDEKTRIEAIDKLKQKEQELKKQASESNAFKKIMEVSAGNVDNINNYTKNPKAFISVLIDFFSRVGDGKKDEKNIKGSPINKYLSRHKDVNQLLNDFENQTEDLADAFYQVSTQDRIEFLKIHTELVTIETVLNDLESENTNLEEYSKELVQLNIDSKEKQPTPTNQQRISIREVLKWFGKKEDLSQIFNGWAYLDGKIGAGKTSVFAKYVINLISLYTNKPVSEIIYTASDTQITSDNIAKALGLKKENENSPTVTTLLEDLKKDNIHGARLIIIDEAARFEQDILSEVATEVAKYNERNKDKQVKVLAMGDSSQISSENVIFSPSSLLKPEINKVISNVFRINPLSISYRSSVSAIADIQDRFENKAEDVTQNIVTKSNIEDSASEEAKNKPLYGVSGSLSETHMLTTLANRPAEGRKVLIVNKGKEDEWKAKLNSKGINNVEVFSYYNAQGQTADEVYIWLDPKSDDFIGTKIYYNTAIYTSARATKFLYLGFMDVKTVVDENIISKEKEKELINKERAKNTIEETDKGLTRIEKALGEKAPETEFKEPVQTQTEEKQEEQKEEERIHEEEEQDPVEEDPNDLEDLNKRNNPDVKEETKVQLTPGTNPDEIHYINFPTHSTTQKGLEKGEQVYIVPVSSDNGTDIKYVILKSVDEEGKVFSEVGVLGKDEVKQLGFEEDYKSRKKDLDAKIVIPYTSFEVENGTQYTLLDSSLGEIAKATIEHSQPLEYVYGPEKASIFNLATTIKNWVKGFYPLKNNIADEKTTAKNSEILTFNTRSASIANRGDASNKGLSKRLIYGGHTYLVINDTDQKNGGVKAAKQYIELTPRLLNGGVGKSNDVHMHEIILPMRDFIKRVSEIEAFFKGKLKNKDGSVASFELSDKLFNSFIRIASDNNWKSQRNVEDTEKDGTKKPAFDDNEKYIMDQAFALLKADTNRKNLTETIESIDEDVYLRKTRYKYDLPGKEITSEKDLDAKVASGVVSKEEYEKLKEKIDEDIKQNKRRFEQGKVPLTYKDDDGNERPKKESRRGPGRIQSILNGIARSNPLISDTFYIRLDNDMKVEDRQGNIKDVRNVAARPILGTKSTYNYEQKRRLENYLLVKLFKNKYESAEKLEELSKLVTTTPESIQAKEDFKQLEDKVNSIIISNVSVKMLNIMFGEEAFDATTGDSKIKLRLNIPIGKNKRWNLSDKLKLNDGTEKAMSAEELQANYFENRFKEVKPTTVGIKLVNNSKIIIPPLNNTKFKKSNIKKGVSELFESNPELANAVYEALGFSKKLDFYKGDTLTIDEKIYNIVEKISSKELAKRNGLTISSNIPVYIVSEFLGSRKGGYDTVNNIIILSKDSDKETIHHELIHSVEYNLDKSELNHLYEKVKDSITEDSFNGFVSWNFKKNISEFVADALSKKVFRNALKKEGLLEEVDNVLSVYTSDTTPQQKQQAQQLYSQYLEQNPNGNIDGFKEFVSNNVQFNKETPEVTVTTQEDEEAALLRELEELNKTSESFNTDDIHRDPNEKGVPLRKNSEEAEDVTKSRKIEKSKILSYVRRFIPNITEEQIKFLEQTELMKETGSEEELWGAFKDGVLLFEVGEDGTVYEAVLKHEVFHNIFRFYLTDAERLRAYHEAREEFGWYDKTNSEIEEALAGVYQNRDTQNVFSYYLNRLFNKIKRIFGFISENEDFITDMFNKIDNGYFRDLSSEKLHGFAPLIKYLKAFKNDFYVLDKAESIITSGINNILYNSEEVGKNLENLPMTMKEAQDQFIKNAQLRLKALKTREERWTKFTEEQRQNPKLKAFELTDDEVLEKKALGGILKGEKNKEDGTINYSMLDNLLKQIYPNRSFLEESEDDEISEEAESLQNVIEKDKEINPHSSLSDAVRDWIITISTKPKVGSDGKVIVPSQKVSVNFGLHTLYNKLTNLDTNNVTDLKNNIDAAFSDELTWVEIKKGFMDTQGNAYVKAIHSALKALVNKAYEVESKHSTDEKGRKLRLPDDMKFTSEDRFIFNEKTNLQEVVRSKKYNSKGEITEVESTKDFLDRIIKRVKEENSRDLSYDFLKDVWVRDRAMNTFKELMTLVNSLAPMNPSFGIIENKYGSATYRYSKYQDDKIRETYIDNLKASIANSINSGTAWTRIMSEFEKYLSKTPSELDNVPVEDKIKAINVFLKSLGVTLTTLNLSPRDADINFKHLADRSEGLIAKIENFKKNTSEDKDIMNLLANNKGFLRDLASALRSTERQRGITTYQDGEGKKRFFQRYMNFATKIVIDIIRNNGGKIKQELDEFMGVNLFLHNYFNPHKNAVYKNINKIFDYSFHDSIKDDFTERAWMFNDEESKDYFIREVLLQFTGSLNDTESSQDKLIKYWQSVYTLSDKPVTMSAQVGMLSDDKEQEQVGTIKKALAVAVKQEALRPAKEGVYNLKDYTPNKTELTIQSKDKTTGKIVNYGLTDEHLAKVKLAIGSTNEDKIINEVVDHLYKGIEKRSAEVAQYVIDMNERAIKKDKKGKTYLSNEGLVWDSNLLSHYATLLNKGLIKKESLDSLEYEIDGKKVKVFNITKSSEGKYSVESSTFSPSRRNYSLKVEHILPIIDLYYKNNYINGLMLNQITTGDQAIYKSAFDQVKRMSIFHGIGQAMVIDGDGSKFSQKKFKIAIVNDIFSVFNNDTKETDYDFRHPELVKSKFNMKEFKKYVEDTQGLDMTNWTDGQGFMDVWGWEELKRGFGLASNNKYVLKPVYAGIDKHGVNRTIKYSSVVLTDQLVAKFPMLGELREQMRNHPGGRIREVVMDSATKTAVPENVTKFNYETGLYDPFTNDSVIELDNDNWRIQLNPNAKVDSKVALFTQLVYFADFDGNNPVETKVLYNTLSKLFNFGLDKVNSKLNSNRDSSLSKRDQIISKIRSIVLSKISGMAGKEKMQEFLQNDQNKEHVSINAPFLVNDVVTQMASFFSKNIIKPTFSGSKFVLQSAALTGEYVPKYNYDTMIAEVYLPNLWKDKFPELANLSNEEIDKLGLFLGFRIPSTGLNSAARLKIKGFYPSDQNIVISPPDLTRLHGSDFDVDTLYIIKPEKSIYAFEPLNISKADVIGFDKDGKEIPGFEKKITDMLNDESMDKRDKETLDKLYFSYLKNKIVFTYLNLLGKRINRDAIINPISFDKAKGINNDSWFDTVAKGIAPAYGETYDATQANAKSKRESILSPKRTLNDTLDRMQMQLDNKSAKKLVGVAASSAKVLAYLLKSAQNMNLSFLDDNVVKLEKRIKHLSKKPQENATEISNLTKQLDEYKANKAFEQTDQPYLQEKYHIKLNGKTFTKLVRKDETGTNISETLSILVNASIDNVKEQILSTINFSSATANSFLTLVGLGVNPNTIIKLMRQPSIMEFADKAKMNEKLLGDSKAKLISKLLEIDPSYNVKELVEKTLPEETIEVTDERLEENMKYFSNNELTTIEQIEFQLAVIQLMTKATLIGKGLLSSSRVLSIVQDNSVKYSELEDYFNAVSELYVAKTDSIEIPVGHDIEGHFTTPTFKLEMENGKPTINPNFPFMNIDLFSIDHFKAAYEQYDTLMGIFREGIYKHNPQIEKLVRAVKEIFDFKLSELGNPAEDVQMIKDELIKYLMTGIEFQNFNYNVNFSTENEPKFKLKNISKKSTIERYVYGSEAFSQRFIERVQESKAKHPDNLFLKRLRTTYDPTTKLWRLQFTDTSNLDFKDMKIYEEEFKKIDQDLRDEFTLRYPGNKKYYYSEFQMDFIKYSVIDNGLRFGATTFNVVLPKDIYTPVFKRFDQLMEKIIDSKDEKIFRLIDHFGLSLAMNKASDLSSSKQQNGMIDKALSGRIDMVDNKPVFWNVRYKLDLAEDEDANSRYKDYDKVILHELKSNFNNRISNFIAVKLPDIGNGYIYYQITGQVGRHSSYEFNQGMLDTGYYINNHFDPHVIYVMEDQKETEKLLKDNTYLNKNELQEGQSIEILSRGDRTRKYTLQYEITKIIKPIEEEKIKEVDAKIKKIKEDLERGVYVGEDREKQDNIISELYEERQKYYYLYSVKPVNISENEINDVLTEKDGCNK